MDNCAIFGAVLDLLTQITFLEMLLIAIGFLLGFVLGWVFWGGQSGKVRDLEDELEITRIRMRHVIVDDPINEKPSSGQGEDHIEDQAVGQQVADKTAGKFEGRIHAQIDDDSRFNENKNLIQTKLSSKTKVVSGSQKSGLKNQGLTTYNDDNIKKLKEELDIIRALINNRADVDPLKEHLDQSDTSLKKANGRLKLLMRAVEKGEDVKKGEE